MRSLAKAHKVALAAALLIAAGLFSTWALAAGGSGGVDSSYLPDADQAGAEKISVETNTAQVVRSLEEPRGEVKWTLVSYLSSDGLCRDWQAEQIGGADAGMVGGCGGEIDGPFSWSLGGVELGGQWYNVVFGTGIDGASEARVTLADGTTRMQTIANGVWLVAIPGPNPVEQNGFDVKRIELVSPAGVTLTSADPPSVNWGQADQTGGTER